METLTWSDGPTFHLLQGLVFLYSLDTAEIVFLKIIRFSYIAYYSTTQTADAAYIIGGSNTYNVVAEYRNDQWSQLDDLNTGRYAHGSITIGSQTMIIGGMTASSS